MHGTLLTAVLLNSSNQATEWYVLIHVMNLHRFDDTETDLVSGHGAINISINYTHDDFHSQSNHSKYTTLLISSGKLPELYILTSTGVKEGKIKKKKKKKKNSLRIGNYLFLNNAGWYQTGVL